MSERRPPEILFEGRVFRIERDVVRLENGRDTTVEAVRHRGSVVILAQPAPGNIVVIRQFRPVINRWIWEVPAGSLDPGEAPDDAVVRECQEEIGLTPHRVQRLASWFPSPGFCDEIMHFYHCTDLAPAVGPVAQDADEQIEPATVSLTDLRAMITDGRVVDMKTVLALSLLTPD